MTIFTTGRQWGAIAGLLLLVLSACTSNMTYDERLEREYARVEREAEIHAFVAACERAKLVTIYTGATYPKLRDPTKHIPSHARKSDYQCVTTTAVSREF